MLNHLENSVDLDPKLQKAPVNYEGVSLTQISNNVGNHFTNGFSKVSQQISSFSPLFLVKLGKSFWLRRVVPSETVAS